MRRVPKYLLTPRSWRDVKPGMLIGASYGIVRLVAIERVPEGVLVTPEGQLPWIQHPSQTIEVATRNPAYKGQ